MTSLKCIITDDEPFAIKGLKGYVEKIDFLELVATCENALELNQILQTETIDLLFLDIQMPYLSGIDFLKGLKNPPMVVFTTAHPEYALDGYELDVLDYLLKPIPFARFLKASNKARDLFELNNKPKEVVDYFFVKSEKRLEKITASEILFAESMQNYVKIHTETNVLTVHLTLKALKTHLSVENFVQPHRSFLVAIDKIRAIEGNQIFLDSGESVPISKYLKDEALSQIVNYQLTNKP